MKFSRLRFIPLVREIVCRIFVLSVVLSVAPFAMASESDGRSSVGPEPNINLEQPFVVTILLYDKKEADANAKALADSVGAKIAQANRESAKYWLRLSTKNLIEVGAIIDKLEADPRVFKVKWDIR